MVFNYKLGSFTSVAVLNCMLKTHFFSLDLNCFVAFNVI